MRALTYRITVLEGERPTWAVFDRVTGEVLVEGNAPSVVHAIEFAEMVKAALIKRWGETDTWS